ncbi:MAG: hypothetical protein ACRC1H_01675 [Caldilineaceae bacterium]
MMQTFGRATLADLFDDWVVYRSLEPLDKRVPGFKAAAWKMGLTEDRLPRKQDLEYAKAATWIVSEAQQVRGGKPLRELLFLGDTLFNDGQAHRNMVQVSGWKGSCFIGVDRANEEPAFAIDPATNLYSANRWNALPAWVAWLRQTGHALDNRTAVIVDIDKTALGAKGRNDQVIDRARLEGIFRTMTSVLGAEGFNQSLFVEHYGELNRSRYHFLTADNQDYLAYICLMLNAGMVSFDELTTEIATNSIENFDQFIRWADSRMMINNPSQSLLEVHESVLSSVRSGDPTPFKRFRRQEFVCTVEHMGSLDDSASPQELLDREITLTEEVFQTADWFKQRGCFLLCLSDKPDEASRPSKGHTADLPPIHRAPTHRVGEDIRSALSAIA